MKYIKDYNAKQISFIEKDTIQSILYTDIEKMDVIIRPVQKEKKEEVKNTLANLLSSSISNGNEKMHVGFTIRLKDKNTFDIFFEETVIRYSDAYNTYIQQARSIQKFI